MKILVTGGADFIGSAVIRHIIQNTNDRLTLILPILIFLNH
ncbi:hypothetical protein SHX45_017450 [Vibrio cholerae]|nr:hypothetical protein [Vibrio cholerae]MDX5009873.1 hypothetical protein [Vibrio cholerae]